MGSGCSVLPNEVDEETAKAVSGAQWDLAAFRNAARDVNGKLCIASSDFVALIRERCGAEGASRYLAMSVEELEEEARIVLEAAVAREARRQRPADQSDYSKSLSGTAEDTAKEREAAELMRGDATAEEDDPLLLRPLVLTPGEHQELEARGKWLKFMGSAGCFLYIHSLTRELRSTRPEAFVEEKVASKNSRDAYNGLPTVDLTALPAEIERIVSEERKTPLVLDASEDRKVATFYSFKGVLVDGTKLALPVRDKARPKPKAWLEEARAKAVVAMKRGVTLAVDLGEAEGSKAPLVSQWCKADGLRKELFNEAGKSLARNKMALGKMFRDDEKEYGECIVRALAACGSAGSYYSKAPPLAGPRRVPLRRGHAAGSRRLPQGTRRGRLRHGQSLPARSLGRLVAPT